MSGRKEKIWDAVVVGAGAAGVFAALRAKQLQADLRILVLERGPKPLRKVSISGGGRCNVTHHCHDLDRLLAAYPRGGPRLEKILMRFMPSDTVEWYQSRGVKLKTESDGRMFPVSNSSQTVIDCLLGEAHKLGVSLRCKSRVDSLQREERHFVLKGREESWRARKVLLATGGGSKATAWLETLGHQLEADIPSLFTFCVEDPLLQGLAGLSVNPVQVSLNLAQGFQAEGPLLVTHWGLSGPAVLKLSAFAARDLFHKDYRAELLCDFLPDWEPEALEQHLSEQTGNKQVSTSRLFPQIPKRLWQGLVQKADIGQRQAWSRLKPVSVKRLTQVLKACKFSVQGKGQFKEEFVTSGGLPLHEIDVYTMESRRTPGLYVAGELLNVDGITGGYNFQNAWAGGFVAGEGLAAGVLHSRD